MDAKRRKLKKRWRLRRFYELSPIMKAVASLGIVAASIAFIGWALAGTWFLYLLF